jgi:hypothetical protein
MELTMNLYKKLVVSLCLLSPLAATAGLIGVNNNFKDNGDVTTEYRSDGTVWQWLDLTVTNGISLNSVEADLDDDGILNGSAVRNGSAGAYADVAALATSDTLGWQTVSNTAVIDMFNSFFGLTLVSGDTHNFHTDVLDVEDFINAFGDTYSDGYQDLHNVVKGSVNGNPTIGFTYGYSNVVLNDQLVQYVRDSQFNDQNFPSNEDDVVVTGIQLSDVEQREGVGTWLVREVNPVPEPTTITIFTLALMGLAIRRRMSA